MFGSSLFRVGDEVTTRSGAHQRGGSAIGTNGRWTDVSGSGIHSGVVGQFQQKVLPTRFSEEAITKAKVLLPTWLPGGSWQAVEWVSKNSKRNDRKAGSLSINSSTGKWKDFSSGDGGADLVSLYAWLNGTGPGEACKALAAEFGISLEAKPKGKAVAAVPRFPRPILPVPEGVPAMGRRPHEEGRWEFRDAEGRLLVVRVRTPDPERGKAVITYTWCETGLGMAEWRPKAPEHPWPLYGLDRLAKRPDAPVLVVEGEKTADAAEWIFPGTVAVTSGSADSAAAAGWDALAGRSVVIWPDADDAGQGYAVKVAGLLAGKAAEVRLVALPAPITDWVKPGKDKPGVGSGRSCACGRGPGGHPGCRKAIG